MDTQNYNEMYKIYLQITSDMSKNVSRINEDAEHMLTVYDLILTDCFIQNGMAQGEVSAEELEFIKGFGNNVANIRTLSLKFPYFLRHCNAATYAELKEVVFPPEELQYFKDTYKKINYELPGAASLDRNGYIQELLDKTGQLLELYAKGFGVSIDLKDYLNGLFADSIRTEGASSNLQTVVSGKEAVEKWINESKPETKEAETKEQILDRKLKELEGMIGLEPVKREIQNLVFSFKADKMRAEMGLDTFKDNSYHLVFSGSPGTGKTTVARLIGEIYYCLDILPSTNFVECSKADLEAGYVGQTALKTTEVVESALGGVLFIDEAYSLIKSDYGREAIDILVQMMENHRSELVLIVAGYARDMEEFLQANVGLRSRFKRTIHFPNYSGEELMQILEKFLKGWTIPWDVKEYAITQFSKAATKPGFGNGRMARDIAGKIKGNIDLRIGHMAMQGIQINKEMLQTVTMDDVVEAFAQCNTPNAKNTIGF